MTIDDVIDDVEIIRPTVDPEEEKIVYSKTLERYNIDLNEWSYSNNMNISRF